MRYDEQLEGHTWKMQTKEPLLLLKERDLANHLTRKFEMVQWFMFGGVTQDQGLEVGLVLGWWCV